MASMLMELTHEEITGGVVVITLSGKIMRGPESERIVSLTEELLREGKRTIIFDLSGVMRIDSTGIGRFIAAYTAVDAAGGQMRLASASPIVFQAFHVSRLDTVFKFYPTLSQACQA